MIHYRKILFPTKLKIHFVLLDAVVKSLKTMTFLAK